MGAYLLKTGFRQARNTESWNCWGHSDQRGPFQTNAAKVCESHWFFPALGGPEAKQNHSGIGIGVSSINIWTSQFIATRESSWRGLVGELFGVAYRNKNQTKLGLEAKQGGSYCLPSTFPAVERCNLKNLHNRTRFCKCFMRSFLSCFILSILRPNQAIGDCDLLALTTRQVQICRCSMPHFTWFSSQSLLMACRGSYHSCEVSYLYGWFPCHGSYLHGWWSLLVALHFRSKSWSTLTDRNAACPFPSHGEPKERGPPFKGLPLRVLRVLRCRVMVAGSPQPLGKDQLPHGEG